MAVVPVSRWSDSLNESVGLSLIGYRGAGKSAIGRRLSLLAARPFFDLDTEIERRRGRKISLVFAEEGEPAFRDYEQAALQEVVFGASGAIIATGGGAILRPENRLVLRRYGPVVWLDAPVDVLAARLAAERSDRPALTNLGVLGEIATVLERRLPLYRETADHLVSVAEKTIEEIAQEILVWWESWSGRSDADVAERSQA